MVLARSVALLSFVQPPRRSAISCRIIFLPRKRIR
jgi:hypothetical protein